jgi:hypothetical protein
MSGCGRASAKQPASKDSAKRFWAQVTNRLSSVKSVLFTGQAFAAAQQFGIDLREFLDLLLELVVVLDPR